MEQAYIVSAIRTPLGRFGGALAGFSPVDLGAIAMREALDRAALHCYQCYLCFLDSSSTPSQNPN